MITAVLDTNVLVSGFGWRDSAPGQIVDAVVAGELVAVTSPDMLDELKRVLSYPKLTKAMAGAGDLAALIEQVSLVVRPFKRWAVLADESDNRFLEAAAAVQADYLVTGDGDLLALEAFAGTRIVTPRAFLEALRSA